MTIPAELTERSYYTVIMSIGMCIGENNLSRERVLQSAAKYEKIHVGLKQIEITYALYV